jgi:hypothetical protein
MRIWFALLAAPLLALADQAIAYATAGWGCANQNGIAMQLLHAGFLAAVLGGTVAAWQMRRATSPGIVRHFLAGLATASGALSALVIFAMWIPTWIVAACSN